MYYSKMKLTSEIHTMLTVTQRVCDTVPPKRAVHIGIAARVASNAKAEN